MAMSSLAPGVLFKAPGLNRRHTPTQITATSDLVKSKYRRASIPEKDWPPESPVAQIYDISNTSSNLIILNNKMQKKSHLRVQSGRYRSPSDSGEEKTTPVETTQPFGANIRRHEACRDSSSPAFYPTPSRPPTSGGANTTLRYRYPATAGAPQPTEWHHYSSQVDRPSRAFSAPPLRSRSAGRRSKAIEPPPCFRQDKKWLQHPDMTYGQKKYMNSIACTYDVTHMKQLKQAQYLQLIHREQQRDFFTPEEYKKYIKYLSSERTRQFNSKSPPPAHSRLAAPKSARSKANRFPNNSKPVSARISHKKEAVEDKPKQSAPKPFEQRSHSPPRESTNQHEEELSEKRRVSRSDEDATEYMMYSEPDSPRREKPTFDRSHRPKSSKYRVRNEQIKEVDLDDSEEEGNEEDRPEKFWQQPPPPIKETEPDGKGLNMTEEGDLNRDGEAIEEISFTGYEEKRKSSKASSTAVESGSDEDKQTYDIKHEDGTKTRVYAPPLDKTNNQKDIPVVAEKSSGEGEGSDDSKR